MNIIFWGTPTFCIPIFDAINTSKHQIIAVVTQPDKRRGRGNKIIHSSVKEKAIINNIPVLTPDKVSHNIDFERQLSKLNADLFVIVAYGQILPKNILELPPLGCWNVHASLLPRWRGAAPIQWSIIKGDRETGVSIMFMQKGLDTGPILLEQKIPIEPLDNSFDLTKKLSKVSARLIISALERIEDSRDNFTKKILDELIEQSTLNRDLSYARMISKDDLIICWESSALEIYKKILGLFPNAYTLLNGKRIKILQAIPYDKFFIKELALNDIAKAEITLDNDTVPGDIVGKVQDLGILVKTNDIPLLILKLRIEGKKDSQNNQLIQQFLGVSNKTRLGS